MNDKHQYDMKYLNYHNSDMLAKITDTISKTDNQEEELTDISSKISTYEVLTINFEHPSSEYNFESKFQGNISPSDQSFEKKE